MYWRRTETLEKKDIQDRQTDKKECQTTAKPMKFRLFDVAIGISIGITKDLI
jgi:hypothetical protein